LKGQLPCKKPCKNNSEKSKDWVWANLPLFRLKGEKIDPPAAAPGKGNARQNRGEKELSTAGGTVCVISQKQNRAVTDYRHKKEVNDSFVWRRKNPWKVVLGGEEVLPKRTRRPTRQKL